MPFIFVSGTAFTTKGTVFFSPTIIKTTIPLYGVPFSSSPIRERKIESKGCPLTIEEIQWVKKRSWPQIG